MPAADTPILMSNVKVVYDVSENKSEGELELSSLERNAYEQMQIAMRSLFMLNDVTIQRHLEAVKQLLRIL